MTPSITSLLPKDPQVSHSAIFRYSAVTVSKHKQEETHKYTAVLLPNLKVQFEECVRLHVGGMQPLLGKNHTEISWEITL